MEADPLDDQALLSGPASAEWIASSAWFVGMMPMKVHGQLAIIRTAPAINPGCGQAGKS